MCSELNVNMKKCVIYCVAILKVNTENGTDNGGKLRPHRAVSFLTSDVHTTQESRVIEPPQFIPAGLQ